MTDLKRMLISLGLDLSVVVFSGLIIFLPLKTEKKLFGSHSTTVIMCIIAVAMSIKLVFGL